MAGVESLMADAEAHRINPSDSVRVTGVVTDDDGERGIAFLADGKRAIAVHTGPAGLNVPAGRRITLEAHLDSSATPSLVDPVVLDSKDDRLPDPVVVDGAEAFAPGFAGRRVLLDSNIQAAAMTDRRLQLTLTTHGVQLLAEVRRPDAANWRSLIGANVRLRGVVVPADRVHGFPARIAVASAADVEPMGVVQTVKRERRLLTSAAAIQALPREEAAAGHPVKLSARIMVWDAEWSVLFVHDGSGIFVFTRSLEHPMPRVRPGDVAEIEGETGPGEFAPVIAAHRITITGHPGLPAPREVPLHRLLSGREDSQFVEFPGIVRSIGRDDKNHLAIELSNSRERIPGFVAAIDGQTVPAGLGVDAVVRVKAVVGTRFNDNRQIVGVQFFIPTVDEIAIDVPAVADPFKLPITTVNGLLDFTSADRAGRRVRLRGVVMLARDQVVYLRDSVGALEVHTAAATKVRPGDLVDAVGFPGIGAYSPLLEDSTLRQVGTAESPRPVETTAIDVLRSRQDGALLKLRGRVLQFSSTQTEDVLIVDGDGTTFTALLDRASTDARLMPLAGGSLVELTGISSIQVVTTGQPARAPGVPNPPAVARGGARHRGAPLVHRKPRAVGACSAEHPDRLVAGLDRDAASAGAAADTPAHGCEGSRRGGESREERVRGQHEPRDSHADERRARHDRAPARGAALIRDQRSIWGWSSHPPRRCSAIINDILDFSKIEAGKLDLESAPVRAPADARGHRADARGPRAPEGAGARRGASHPSVPDGIVADAERLRQVLLNLVGNAVKFTEQGEVVVDVALAGALSDADASECALVFAVRDTGIGISDDKQALVFQAFAQADGSDHPQIWRHRTGARDLGPHRSGSWAAGSRRERARARQHVQLYCSRRHRTAQAAPRRAMSASSLAG